ncbi:hypothetical protein [Streptomyces sp. NPDC001292]
MSARSPGHGDPGPDVAAAFGEWCGLVYLVYTVHGEVIEVLDIGCAR